jgi:hypothetical protein
MALGTRSAEGGDDQGPPVSPDVRHMLSDISATNIENSINTLASFGTRHTLSSQTDPNRGIGAATNWIYDQFQQYAADSDGRLTVEKQTFIQPPGPRNPNPVSVTNVIATLHGTQPESANRIYLVSGHIDSRCTDVLDFTCDAPDADDDASGVAGRSTGSQGRSSDLDGRHHPCCGSRTRSPISRATRSSIATRTCRTGSTRSRSAT